MDALRLAFRSRLGMAWVVLSLNAACAADAGDPLKTPMDESGPGVSTELDASGEAPDDDFGDSAAPGTETGAVVGGDDAGEGPPDSSQGGAQPDTSTGLDADAVPEASFGDGGCLQDISASCACKTQNASDMPICQRYVMCFATNNCNPNTACGTNSGVCGVNTIGGGEAPYTAAVTTYNCACP
jgi:hypothetical protein